MSKKAEKAINELMNVTGRENEAIVVIYKDEKDDIHVHVAHDDKLAIPSAIATLLDDYYGDEKEEGKDLAEGIVKGLCAVIERYGIAGRRLSMAIMPSLTTAAKNALGNIRKHLEKIANLENNNRDEDDDDTEDCENCDERYDCQLSDAIKWRKANGVPAPPRNRKARKGNKKNEQKGN